MKRNYKFLFLNGVILLFLFTGCKKFNVLQQNPNASTIGTPQYLLTGLMLDMVQGPNAAFYGGTTQGGSQYNGPWSYTQRANQYYVLTESYYGDQDYASEWTSGSWYYSSLLNARQLDNEVTKEGGTDATAYHAITQFIRAFYYLSMTEQMGDIPMSEAVQGDTKGVFQPSYDTQKDVFIQCLKWLASANDSLAALLTKDPTASVDGDIFYNGNLQEWRKAINSLRLRVLINLSLQVNDPDLNLKSQFQQIVNNSAQYPIMTTNSDNLQMVYNSTETDNYYTLWPQSAGIVFSTRNVLGATWVNLMDSLQDPRLLIIGSPVPSLPFDPNDPYKSYVGANTGELQSSLQSNETNYSRFNVNYWVTGASGIPCIQLGVSETDFNIAEAINRGWISGDASTYYNQGIITSMEFYGVSSSEINSYINKVDIQYAGNNAAGLKQILTQKYIAFFNNSGWQAYYNFRRTGIPSFATGPSNQNGGVIPLRFLYPQSEYQNNTANVTAAIKSRFGGADTRNGVMWLLK